MNKNKLLLKALLAVALVAAVYAGAVVATEGNVWPGPQVWNSTAVANGTLTANGAFTANAGADITGLTLAHTRVDGTVGTYTMLETDDVIDVSGGTAQTITLPSAPPVGKMAIIFAYNSTLTTTIAAPDGYSVMGATTNTALNKAGEAALLQYNGTDWTGAVVNQ